MRVTGPFSQIDIDEAYERAELNRISDLLERYENDEGVNREALAGMYHLAGDWAERVQHNSGDIFYRKSKDLLARHEIALGGLRNVQKDKPF